MFAIRQIIEDPQDVIPVPPEFRNRRTEVIFLALDQESDAPVSTHQKTTHASLAGSGDAEAWIESRDDLAAGRFIKESPEDHLTRLDSL